MKELLGENLSLTLSELDSRFSSSISGLNRPGALVMTRLVLLEVVEVVEVVDSTSSSSSMTSFVLFGVVDLTLAELVTSRLLLKGFVDILK